MLLVSSLLLVLPKLSFAEENCTDACLDCVEGICLECADGYYYSVPFRKCKVCLNHCKDWGCGKPICPFGCVDGWYRLQCDMRCDDNCETGRCEQYYGGCLDSDDCEIGVCTHVTNICDKYCEKHDVQGDEMAISSEVLFCLIMGTVLLLLSCLCCMVKYRRKSNDASRSSNFRMDIVPSGQRLLPGQEPNTFISSNGTNSHLSLRDAHLDSDYVLRYPSNASADVTKSDIPPPYEEKSESPPSYDMLFKNTAPSSGDCASPQ